MTKKQRKHITIAFAVIGIFSLVISGVASLVFSFL